MGQNFSVRKVIASLVLLSYLMSRPCAAQMTAARSTLNILLLNYSSAPAEVLVKASAETSRIFARSGIDLTWTYCPPRRSPDSDPACDSEASPGEIRVRLLGPHVNHAFQDAVFGFAIAPTFATVYYDSAQLLVQTESDSESYLPVVLGGLMAHEIGHLLLGETGHTVSGIMQAGWDIRQIQQLMKGALQFSPEQTVRILMNSHARSRQVTGTRPNTVQIASVHALRGRH